MKRVSVLGSTGSIGVQALEVISLHKLTVTALAAKSNIELLEEQARRYKPETVCIYDEEKYSLLKSRLADMGVKVVCGMHGLCEIAAMQDTDVMLNSVVGMVGLLPTLTAIGNGTSVALANKETLVAGGNLVMELAEKKGVAIYPVDSEHSAVFQCMQGNKKQQVSKVILTASGGPFFGKTKSELRSVTLEQALSHPNWSMGNKITIDSATMMNKGLEFIEAKWLFGLKPEQIEVVVHRQSVVHSAVEYDDYSVIAQLGCPDMRIPIQYALLYPERVECPVNRLSLTEIGRLTFEKPDYDTFECLGICKEAIKKGGAYPCIVNAANETAVQKFIDGEISFLEIGELVKSVFEHFEYHDIGSYEDVIRHDRKAREYTELLVIGN